MHSYSRVHMSKKQRDLVMLPLTICLIGITLFDWFTGLFFDFEISHFLYLKIVLALSLALCGVNLVYYWRGEGAAARERSDYLRMLTASTVCLLVILGLFFWYGQ